MRVGDIVRVKASSHVGVIVELLHATSVLPVANTMVLGNIGQFYLDELEVVNESR